MEGKSKPVRRRLLFTVLLLFLQLCAQFRINSSTAIHSPLNLKKHQTSKCFATSAIFPLHGNVYPNGYFYALVNIGEPPKPYYLDVDSGSDLSWVQCDAPCQKCVNAPHSPYRPIRRNLVRCKDPLCKFLPGTTNFQCIGLDEQCDYEVKYADHGSSVGVLVRDNLSIQLTNGSVVTPLLAFGCGYDQQQSSEGYTDGVLGIGNGKAGILSQLSHLGLTHNVVGHCLSSRGGGFLFFGNHIVPSLGMTWAPMSMNSLEKYYSCGGAQLSYGSQEADGLKDLSMVFDSGSSYTYLNFKAYQALLLLIQKNVKGRGALKETDGDTSLPVCWRGEKLLKSMKDVNRYFETIVVNFDGIPLHIWPEGYLIITEKGNACLGILNGSEVGLEHRNVIGDISMQDKMVVYDNEERRIGWGRATCERLPTWSSGTLLMFINLVLFWIWKSIKAFVV